MSENGEAVYPGGIRPKSAFRAVCLGGGCGASQVMMGLRAYTTDITGIIAVTDSGRSTGKIRVAVGVPAPGDIRNALVTLSDGDGVLKDLFQHRFVTEKSPDLNGMAFGNLFIAALAQMTGSFDRAVRECERLLQLQGRVLPVTLYNTHLCAELMDGTMREEEVNVRALNKPPIKRVFLNDHPIETSADCVAALTQADLITIGPGSLYTTVIACLLVNGIAQGIRDSRATCVYVANTTTQPGQTDGLSLSYHVSEVMRYLGGDSLDYVLVNDSHLDDALLARYHADGVHPLACTTEEVARIENLGPRAIVSDFVERASKRDLWQKQDSLRHDPERVARVLVQLLEERQQVASPPDLPGLRKPGRSGSRLLEERV